MRKKQLDVLGVCETRWGDNDDFWSDDFKIIHSGGKQGKNGVVLLLNNNYGTCVENNYHVNEGCNRYSHMKTLGLKREEWRSIF